MTCFLLNTELDTWKIKYFHFVQGNKPRVLQPLLKVLDFGEAQSRVQRRRLIEGPH